MIKYNVEIQYTNPEQTISLGEKMDEYPFALIFFDKMIYWISRFFQYVTQAF